MNGWQDITVRLRIERGSRSNRQAHHGSFTAPGDTLSAAAHDASTAWKDHLAMAAQALAENTGKQCEVKPPTTHSSVVFTLVATDIANVCCKSKGRGLSVFSNTTSP